MGPPLDDYTLKMRNLHRRYGLSENVLELFKAYGEHHRGVESADVLGRRLRTSTLMKACTDTITSLATAMQKNPTHECITECSEIITCCSEMLNLANEPKQGAILPFMKFPPEIRRLVYQYYFCDLLLASRGDTPHIILKNPHNCNCASHKSHTMKQTHPLEMPLIFACSHIRDEALTEWFKHHVFSFACGCELRHCLQMNQSMNCNLKKVRVHWTGRESDRAFKLLQKVPTLKSLTVVVSKSTTNTESEKEATLRRYLPPRYQTRITEALGFKELEQLVGSRRLVDVRTANVDKSQAHRRSEQERYGLERYLKHVAREGALEG